MDGDVNFDEDANGKYCLCYKEMCTESELQGNMIEDAGEHVIHYFDSEFSLMTGAVLFMCSV